MWRSLFCIMENETKAHEQEEERVQNSGLEKDLFEHYQLAQNELDDRINHKERGFDVYDKLYRNYIDKKRWPFAARVADGRASSIINRKTDRLLANRMQGKMVSKKHGNSLGARVITELINCQWNDIDIHTDEPMLVRLRKMDQNARKYGASFAFNGWKESDRFSGPVFEPLDNRDVLIQPGARNIDEAEWVQVRRYLTIEAMKRANDGMKVGMMPLYDTEAIEKLKEADSKANNYVSINKSVIGLSDDKNMRVEVVTEYRRDRRITFVPKQKAEETIVLSDVPNPYDHGQIPVQRLCYYPIDDDIYGLPELEAVQSLIKTSWAFLSQGLEAAQRELYPIIKGNPTSVQWDTISFEVGKPWLMNSPDDLVIEQQNLNNLNRLTQIFGLLSSLTLEGVGETGQEISQIAQDVGDKTATEVRDTAMLRSARDNANKVVLRQFLSRMVWFWFQMSKQFIDGYKLVNIVGKDAIKYLVEEGMHEYKLSDEGQNMVAEYSLERNLPYDVAYEELRSTGQLEQHSSPMYPVEANGEQLPQLELEENGRAGFLYVTKQDLDGDYDFIPDVEAMSMTDDSQDIQAKSMFFDRAKSVEPQLMQEGTKIKWQDLLESMGYSAKLKEPEQYFEQISEEEMQMQQMQAMQGQMPEQVPGQEQPMQPQIQ